MNKIKWQIHAETSIAQIMLWVIVWKLFGGWVGYLAVLFIAGNAITLFRSLMNMGKDYFKEPPEPKETKG